MKKTAKIISTILLAIMLVATVAGTVFAEGEETSGKKAPDTIITELEDQQGKLTTTNITTLGAKIVDVIQVVGVIVAIVMVLIIGIKYLTASAEGKAEYKKNMMPYLVGAGLVFVGTSIVKFVYSMVIQFK